MLADVLKLWAKNQLSVKMLRPVVSGFTPQASQVAQWAKNPPASVGDARDTVSVSGSGRSPGEGHGYPLQYSCLENSMDRGTWGHKESDTTERLYMYAPSLMFILVCFSTEGTKYLSSV